MPSCSSRIAEKILLERRVKNEGIAVTSDWDSWHPQDGPQKQVCESEADEILIGGSAGIGKTALALILATSYHRRSIIFRREYPQLKEIIQKSKELLRGSGASYNSNDKVWRNIPGDRVIELGAMHQEDDKYNYQGREFSLYVYDEITHFSETQFRYTKTWNRTSLPDEPCRTVATGNPPTEKQGLWVIDYWAPWIDENYTKRTGKPKALPGELRWFVSVKRPGDKQSQDIEVDGPEPYQFINEDNEVEIATPRSRTFITGTLEDNAYLANSGYKATLQALPEPLRSQLLKGLWLSFVEENPWQVIPTEWVNLAVKRWKETVPRPQTHLGVDVARGGKDETIIVSRHGNWIAPLVCFPGVATPDGDIVADQVLLHLVGKSEVRIDIVGVGSSPYDALKRRSRLMGQRLKIIGLSGGKSTDATDRSGMLGFTNARSQWWWHLRELLDPINGINIALPDDPLLIEDLTAPRWSKNSRDVIVVESKDELAKADRLGRSPDRGDAVVYAFADTGTKKGGDYDSIKALIKG